MKSILQLKFMALYIIFGFLSLFTTATLTTQLVEDRLMEDTSRTLYKEAALIASDYLPSYFSEDSPLYAVQSQLAAMRLYLESSLWFVDSSFDHLVQYRGHLGSRGDRRIRPGRDWRKPVYFRHLPRLF